MRASVKRLAALLVAGLLFSMVWLNQQPSRHKPVPERASPAPAPVVKPPAAPVDAGPADEPKHYRPKRASAAVERKVDDFIRRFKDLPAGELQRNEEFSGMLGDFMQLMNTPEFQRKMEERVAAIQAAKGTKHGSLNISFGKLESPESRAWLEAVFSEDTGRMEEFVMNKLDGAIFEFAFDPTMEKTSDGVTVQSGDAPAPVVVKEPD